MTRLSLIAVLATTLLLAGCTTYYQVADPTTGKKYYSTDIEKARDGAVSLTDDRTGADVTIQNSEITELKKGAYGAAVAAPEPAPAPVQAPAPAAAPAQPADSSASDM